MATAQPLLSDSTFAAFGGAVKDLFGAAGANAEATAYGDAAKFASKNATISAESTKIQEYQALRGEQQGLGKIEAGAAANGLTGGGSAGDILRSSAAQGALQQHVIGLQGAIDETSYEAQAAQYRGMESAAKLATASQAGAGIGGLLGGLAPFASLIPGVGPILSAGMTMASKVMK